jgi:nicotinate-nucleotide adenylyltransferase
MSRIFAGLPPSGSGQRIGLYGGSFNPAHDGHRHVSLTALRRLQLDAVWWLVTPGNPLKDIRTLPPLAERMAVAARIARHPRLVVTGVEADLGTRYSADLVRQLAMRLADRRFVWIMGSDSLAGFHRWDRWQAIAASVPIAVVNRPGWLTAPLNAPMAHALRDWRLPDTAAVRLADYRAPAWIHLTSPRTVAASTALRAGHALKKMTDLWKKPS